MMTARRLYARLLFHLTHRTLVHNLKLIANHVDLYVNYYSKGGKESVRTNYEVSTRYGFATKAGISMCNDDLILSD